MYIAVILARPYDTVGEGSYIEVPSILFTVRKAPAVLCRGVLLVHTKGGGRSRGLSCLVVVIFVHIHTAHVYSSNQCGDGRETAYYND